MGHVFAMLNPGRDLPALRSVEGVDDVLRRDGKLVTIADDVVKALRASERAGLFDLAGASRQPDGETAPLDARFADLMRRIKTSRGSKARNALLMLLVGK